MPNPTTLLKPKPTLKPKQTNNAILSISPKPPTENRIPPIPVRDNISRNLPTSREKLSLKDSIDYDKLTVNQQIKWDAGIHGSVHLRTDVKNPYYFVRWRDPKTKSLRSTKLDSDYNRAIAKLRQLTHPD
jgi:hypothetical protein